jgi:DNA polymerase
VLIGEAPGREEDRTGRPFVGRAGNLLNDILEELSIPREDVFITNVVKCRPPENRTPYRTELKACQPYLDAQVQVIRPRMIILLGNTALSPFFSKNDLPERGSVIQRSGISYLWTYHPAACLRNPEYLPVLKIHLKRAVDHLRSLHVNSEREDLDKYL